MSGIYFHIPFCKQACSYCDFYFVTRQHERANFVEALIKEIQSYKGSSYTDEPVESIYLGGGTPSLLRLEEIDEILEATHEVFEVDLKECTVELNPDDVTMDYLTGLRDLGVNRVSMGVQTFNAELLQFMNRSHTAEEAIRCMEILKGSGIRTYTVDLIYGNPGQSLQVLEEDLKQLVGFDPPHVSTYALAIEDKTRLGKQLELGRLIPADEELVEQHFDLVYDRLRAIGLKNYEVNSFSKPGHEAVHNSNYWAHKNYLGLGPGAHSFWRNENEAKALRWDVPRDLKGYIANQGSVQIEKEELNREQLVEERILLGLRTIEGISLAELKQDYGFAFNERQEEYIDQIVRLNKATYDDALRLTDQGLKVADAITLDLITAT